MNVVVLESILGQDSGACKVTKHILRCLYLALVVVCLVV